MKVMKLTSEKLLYFSIILLLLLTCLPITMCFPEIIRKSLQIIAILLFIGGLLLKSNKYYLIGYVMCSLFVFSYVYVIWKYSQSIFTCLFNVLTLMAFVFEGLILLKKKEYKKENYRNKIENVIIILIVFTALTTIIGLYRYPLAVRELGRSGMGYNSSGDEFIHLKYMYRLNNIASWSMVYGMIFFPPYMIAKYKKNREIKYIIFAIIVEFCVFKSQITIGVLLSLFALIMILYTPSKRRNNIIFGFFVILIFTILILFLEDIIYFLISISESFELKTLVGKLTNLAILIGGSGALGDVEARFDTYSKSLVLFNKYPLFGSAFADISNERIFGEHSEFFDLLGCYGIFGLIIIIIMVYGLIRYVRKNVNEGYWIFIVVFIEFTILFVLNPVWYSPQIFAVAFLLPVCGLYSNYKNELQSND